MYFTLTKYKWSKIIAALSWLAFASYAVTGQVLQQKRFEVALQPNEPSYDLTAVQGNGLVLHRFVQSNNQDYLDFIRLDTGLNEAWTGALRVENDLFFVGRKTDQQHLLFLFRHINSADFELFKMEVDSGGYFQYHIPSYIRFSPTDFQVNGSAILIGGYFNRVPLVLHYNTITHQSKVLPGMFNEDGELTQIQVFDDGTFQVMISSRNFLKQRTLWIKNYQNDGSLIDNYALTVDGSKSLIFGRSVKSINNMELIAGVYGHRNSEYSRGIFITAIDPNGIERSRYYNFGDLENFFNYMKARRTTRIKERIERRKIKGKKIKFNYRFLVHEIVEYQGNYVLLGEAFYPQYSAVSRTSYNGFLEPMNVYRGAMLRGGQVFDGFRYTHAVVIGFDKQGKLLWDNSFEINDIRSFTLEQFVRMEVKDDKIALLYLFDDKIRTKIIQDDKVLEGKTMDPIKTQYDNDVLVRDRTAKNELSYWYDNFFIASGVQSIANDVDPVSKQRRVFFVNKIRNP